MALSMEERRLLAEIEVRLTADDPRLAVRMTRLGRDRRRRIRLITAVAIVAVAAAAALAGALLAAFG
ncbi:hypothetical protein BTM25_54650 [Actinomadura rubteroloni]|uniref:DUF3040 domain-containing protein n=1 Tax=Actinomadura rubteroloni TaxID=1926885 RepID=A0A2P4UBU4_9ACTN|nr:DUF3040 domain-containing protein [Actinomadura rubteroloni]POM22515.1 hypothetical protein BTM25_54650 [Actinomadura rubteroloni]